MTKKQITKLTTFELMQKLLAEPAETLREVINDELKVRESDRGIIVEFEDQGQDFLRFVIVDNVVTNSLPLQGWAWGGRRVLNTVLADREIQPGDYLVVDDRTANPLNCITIKYPIIKVSPVKSAKKGRAL